MNRKKMFQIWISLSIALLCSACSKISSAEVDASSIYGQIEVARTESSPHVEVDASFYVGGSTGTMIYLVSPAAVRVNGASANEINDVITNRVHYTANVSASAPAATVVYTDKESKDYSNSIAIPGIFYASVPASISKAAGFSLSYSGSQAFVSGERLEVTLSTSNTSSFQSFSMVTGASSGNQNVGASVLRDFTPGNLSASVCRSRYVTPQAPYPKGLSMVARSCANPVTVTLVP